MTNTEKRAKLAIRSVSSLLGDKEQAQTTICTTKDFFERYMTADDLSDYIKLLRMSTHGISYTEVFFHNIQEGMKITNPVLPRNDKGGNPYGWLTFSNAEGTKVSLNEPILAFINDYRNGAIKPNFDLYSLVEEMDRRMSKQD
jgi:hypothetical protein